MLTHHEVIKESDITIKTDSQEAIRVAVDAIKFHRRELENYISKNPHYESSFDPVHVDADAPEIVKIMAIESEKCNVGPMAGVAGALADLGVAKMLRVGATIAVIENGGEIALQTNSTINVAVLAGKATLSGKVGFRITPKDCPCGIGTSSGTVGHAFSFGVADAAVVFAENATLGDAAATAVCNAVQGEDVELSIQKGLEVAETIKGVRGAYILRDDKAGTVGMLPKFIKIVDF
ncbi:MAG: UPF0280 family protein [Candidatus Helarchaeota archaeon]